MCKIPVQTADEKPREIDDFFTLTLAICLCLLNTVKLSMDVILFMFPRGCMALTLWRLKFFNHLVPKIVPGTCTDLTKRGVPPLFVWQ
jgi:hypothetical protein